MKPYTADIEEQTKQNVDFRRVVFTGPKMQLVLMSLKPGEEIGSEVHEDRDQFFRVEKGQARLEADGQRYELEEDWVAVVPAGVRHNVVNTSQREDLKVYTIYAPPEHPHGTVHKTKAETEEAKAAHA